MADVSIGNITALLKADTTDWQRGLQQAMQSLTAFQQQVQQQSGSVQQGLQASLARTAQALHGVQAAQQQATQSTQQLTQNITQMSTVLQRGQQQAQQFGSAWQTALSVAGGIGLATSITGIVSAMREFATSTIETGARMESLRNSLSALSGSQIQGRQEFDQLFQTAQRLGIAFEPLARGFRQLTAAASQAGVPLQDQMRLMTALATEARRVGISNEELGRSVTAVAQIFSKGKVSMEELRQQLGEALPTAIAAFARGMGRSVEEVEKLVEAGVSATRAGAALTRGFEALQREGGQVAEGLQQAFNRFGNELSRSKDLLTAMAGPLAQIIGLGATALKQVNDLIAARRLLGETLGQEARLGVGLKEGDLSRLPEAQQRRLKEVQDLIAQQQQGSVIPGMELPPAMREANLTILRQEQAAILAQAVALKEQRREQEQVTKAEAQAADQRKVQAETIADLTKQMEALRKVQEDYRRRAAITPELLGRPSGTLEEQAVFQKGLQGALRPGLEKLATAAGNLQPGVTLPADIEAQVRAFDTGYGKIGKAIDDIKDKQQAQRKAESTATQQTHAAIRQEIDLRALLIRMQEELGKGEESQAQQARTRAIQQGTAQRRQLEQAQRQLEESAPLRGRLPQAQPQIQQMLTDLDAATAQRAERAFEESLEKQFVAPLKRLAEAYGETKQARDLDKASMDAYALVGSKFEEQALQQLEMIRAVAAVEGQLPTLRAQAADSARNFEESQRGQRGQDTYLTRLQNRLEQLRAPRQQEGFPLSLSRSNLGLEQQGDEKIVDAQGRARAKALQQEILEAEQLNYVMDRTRQLGEGFGNAWTGALTSIADHTKTVAGAFRDMARSIAQSLAQIAMQEGFRALIRFGAGLITGAATGSLGGGGGTTGMPEPRLFAEGGVVNTPTFALLGERGSSNPEIVMNRQQMQQFIASATRATPSAGGQAAGSISIINVASKEQGDAVAAEQRAMGRQTVMNYVMEDLSAGSGSRIHRAISTLAR